MLNFALNITFQTVDRIPKIQQLPMMCFPTFELSKFTRISIISTLNKTFVRGCFQQTRLKLKLKYVTVFTLITSVTSCDMSSQLTVSSPTPVFSYFSDSELQAIPFQSSNLESSSKL